MKFLLSSPVQFKKISSKIFSTYQTQQKNINDKYYCLLLMSSSEIEELYHKINGNPLFLNH